MNEHTEPLHGMAQSAAPHPLSGLVGPDRTERGILFGLQQRAHIYGGTVPVGVVEKRRAKNKIARRSRRINRKGN